MAAFMDGKLPSEAPSIPSDFALEIAFTNLIFVNPMGIAPVPGSNRLAVWEREGRVWTFENDPGATEKQLILDISNQCQGWGNTGLYSIAFHPGFETNGWLFIYYTWVIPGTVTGDMMTDPPEYSPGRYHDHLARFTLQGDEPPSPDSEVVLIDQVTDSTFHNGGSLFFHPEDGFLYWCNGDDNRGATQVINQNLLSGIFRLDVDQRGGDISHPISRQPDRGTTANYYIPNDNPFVGVPNALEEFYALGLRNPFRMTIDPPTGRIFIGDVGLLSREEINVIEPSDPIGLNFQWSKAEGAGGHLIPPYPGVSKGPLLDYRRIDGGCVVGGHVYRGTKFAAELGGRYIFGDNSTGSIWALDETTTPPRKIVLATLPFGPGPANHFQYRGLSAFGLDAQGEIYICRLSNSEGRIFKLARLSSPVPSKKFPALLSETGLFEDLATLAPSSQLIPYDVNSPLWSDGADKYRWFTVPRGTTIGFSPSGEWRFPPGSVFVKHFEFSDPHLPETPARRVETRVLVRSTEGGVFGVTYKWRADQSDADLVENPSDEAITIGSGASLREQLWHYPSPAECQQCHTEASQGVLGPNTRQLNREFLYPSGVTENQIKAYSDIGLFYPAPALESLQALPKLYHVTNVTASLELRARSYLDSNCSHCHRPGGVRTYWDARFETPLELSGIINGPVSQSFGKSRARTIVPGDPENSIILHRAASLETSVQMPPLAKNVLDTNALEVLAQYISSLPPATNNLPGGWQVTDIGPVQPAGSASFSSGVLSIASGVGETFGVADTFTYVHQELEGDGELTVRVSSITGYWWARTGPMIRASLEQGAPHAFLCLGNAYSLVLFYRRLYDGPTTGPGVNGITAPAYLKLSRSGNDFTGSYSLDGAAWTEIGSVNIEMPPKVYIGVAATGNKQPGNFIFDNIEPVGVPPFNHLPAVQLEALAHQDSPVAGPLLLVATPQDQDGYVPMVEFFQGPIRLGQATSPPYQLLVNALPGEHQFSTRVYDNHGAFTLTQADTLDVKPLTIEIQPSEGESFQFTHEGNPGVVYLVEASPDLISWAPVSTNTPTEGLVQVAVPASPPLRFFRIRPR